LQGPRQGKDLVRDCGKDVGRWSLAGRDAVLTGWDHGRHGGGDTDQETLTETVAGTTSGKGPS